MDVTTAHMKSASMVGHAHNPSAGEKTGGDRTHKQARVVRPNGSQTINYKPMRDLVLFFYFTYILYMSVLHASRGYQVSL